VFKDDLEYDRLYSLAADGVIIDTPDDLVLQSEPEPPRRLQTLLNQAYQKHAYKVWQKRNGIILHIDELSNADKSKLHYNPPHITHKAVPLEQPDNLTEISDSLNSSSNQNTHHNVDTAKVMKIDSRFLMDCSNSESGSVLNTPDVKEKVIQRYDHIQHCTIRDMVQSWYKYASEKNVPLKRCRLFKDDFSGAFTQMDVNPTSAYFLAIAIGSGLVLIYLTGLFGWLGFPMAYAVFSRAFERTFRKDLNIPVHLYVDDIIALSLEENAVNDQKYIEQKCEETFGSKAVSYEKKVTPCLSCEVLGWSVDLNLETLRPGAKGCRKLMFAFWLVASGDRFPLVVYQLLASLAQHYALGLRGLEPFTYPLHNMVAQFKGNKYWMKKPSSAARMSIEIWRVVSVLLWQKNPLMCRWFIRPQ
jgi:hypothetical protein